MAFLAHTTPMAPWPADLTARIYAHHMALIRDLDAVRGGSEEIRRAGTGVEGRFGRRRAASGAYSKAGGQILLGDVGYTDAYDTTEEYRQLGLNWRQILKGLPPLPRDGSGIRPTKADCRARPGHRYHAIERSFERCHRVCSRPVSAYGRAHHLRCEGAVGLPTTRIEIRI